MAQTDEACSFVEKWHRPSIEKLSEDQKRRALQYLRRELERRPELQGIEFSLVWLPGEHVRHRGKPEQQDTT